MIHFNFMGIISSKKKGGGNHFGKGGGGTDPLSPPHTKSALGQFRYKGIFVKYNYNSHLLDIQRHMIDVLTLTLIQKQLTILTYEMYSTVNYVQVHLNMLFLFYEYKYL